MTGAAEHGATISPQPLAADLRSAENRDCPSRNDSLSAALAEVVGGPVGRHALVGRSRLMTPLRVMFLIGLVFLALGWSTKAACLQSTGTGTGDQRVANWDNQRAYYELCYSDTVPLYGAELLNQGKFPYKSSWVETDSTGAQQIRYDGQPAVRYMEYPVLTGMYQYASMALAKTYTALSKLAPLPVVAEVVMFFNISAFGLALAWLATVWASAGLAGRRIWDAALVAASPLLIFQIFTNFDSLATAFAMAGLLAWARRKPVLAGVLIGLGAAAKLYPLLFLGPMLLLGIRTGRLGAWGRTTVAAGATWALVNLPVLVFFPRGWSEFFRLNTRRGDDMDSLYNVIKSFTGWRGFDPKLGFWQPPTMLNTVVAVLFVACCAAIGYIVLSTLPHANVHWRFGPLGYVLVSPAYHRLHHDRSDVRGVNLGTVLVLWDVVAGLAVFPERGATPVATGLAGRPQPVEQGVEVEGRRGGALRVMARQLLAPIRGNGVSDPVRVPTPVPARVPTPARVSVPTPVPAALPVFGLQPALATSGGEAA